MNVDEKRLNIYITETGYELDCIDEEQIDESLLSLYKKDKYEFLIELAFLKEAPSSISLSFLQFISRAFLQAAANDPRFNFAQEPFDIEIDENNIKNGNVTNSKKMDSAPIPANIHAHHSIAIPSSACLRV